MYESRDSCKPLLIRSVRLMLRVTDIGIETLEGVDVMAKRPEK